MESKFLAETIVHTLTKARELDSGFIDLMWRTNKKGTYQPIYTPPPSSLNMCLVLVVLVSCESISNMYSPQDYHSHISRVQRTPSVLTDVPQYPSDHLAFNKTVYEEDGTEGSYHHHHPERVEVVEYEKVPECGRVGGEVIYEENVDVEADQYYPRRNRGGLELHRWKTFRP